MMNSKDFNETTSNQSSQKEDFSFENEYDNAPKKGGGIISKLLIGILALTTGFVGYNAYSLRKQKEASETELNEQKEQIIRELGALKTSYDKAVEENKATSDELIEARNKVSLYIDSLRTMKVTVASLSKYRNQVFALTKERERLLAINDSLRRSNAVITQQRDSVTGALQTATIYADSLVQQNTKLKQVVESGEELQISKLTTEAVKERSSGKLIETSRSRAADKIRVCFTVMANKIAKSGTRYFYVKLVDPSGVTMGQNETTSNENVTVNYSTATRFIYENKNIDVCDFVSKTGDKFERGVYKVTVFDDKLKTIGETEFILK
ncbi:MAG: hypothetical protein Q4C98_04345 [Capnocytophaga sp.]|nr:hypothetical protein [Capnocytophaga sp.]